MHDSSVIPKYAFLFLTIQSILIEENLVTAYIFLIEYTVSLANT